MRKVPVKAGVISLDQKMEIFVKTFMSILVIAVIAIITKNTTMNDLVEMVHDLQRSLKGITGIGILLFSMIKLI